MCLLRRKRNVRMDSRDEETDDEGGGEDADWDSGRDILKRTKAWMIQKGPCALFDEFNWFSWCFCLHICLNAVLMIQ